MTMQEGGERQGANDVAQPVEPGAGRDDGDDDEGGANGRGGHGRTNQRTRPMVPGPLYTARRRISSQGSCRAGFAPGRPTMRSVSACSLASS